MVFRLRTADEILHEDRMLIGTTYTLIGVGLRGLLLTLG